jgi:hypothetical protein
LLQEHILPLEFWVIGTNHCVHTLSLGAHSHPQHPPDDLSHELSTGPFTIANTIVAGPNTTTFIITTSLFLEPGKHVPPTMAIDAKINTTSSGI